MKVKYVFENWDKELLNAAADAVECCIASAFINIGGYNLLEKISKRLAILSTEGKNIPLKILLSDRFAPTERERSDIINKLYELPNIEVRIHSDNRFLHRKNYIFKTSQDIRIVVGSVNTTAGGLYHNLESATFIIHSHNDPEAKKLNSEFKKLWDKAKQGKSFIKNGDDMTLIPKYEKGDNVRIISTGKIGTINQVMVRSDSIGYRVTVDGKKSVYPEKYLEVYVDEEQEIVDALINNEFSSIDGFHLFQTWYRLKRPIEGNYYSYLASRTIFNPFQFKPLSKFIAPGSEERLFIADEVGVGKTIEAGIIITELIARNRIDRRSPILIVCPNSLGPKWTKEMKERFNLNFHFHDGSSLKNALKNVITTGYLPDGAIWSVVALSLLRFSNYLNLLKEINAEREAPLWSMVVIDEAHHMRNITTDSNETGSIISSLAETMLMLSATPLNLKDEDLFNQLHILNPSMFPDIQTFQALLTPVKSLNRCRYLLSKNSPSALSEMTDELDSIESGPLGKAISKHPGVESLKQAILTENQFSSEDIATYDRVLISLSPLDNSFTRALKREALGRIITREPIKVPVELSQKEKAFHDDVINAVKEAFLARGGDPRAEGFVSNMPRRMVSSCIPAMKEYLSWVLENDQINIDESDTREGVDDDSELGTVALPGELREKFKILKEQAEQLSGTDTKYLEFSKLLKKLFKTLKNPQVMVFSFFVRTLKYLQGRLEAEGYRVGLIYGEIPVVSDGKRPSRFDIMEKFEKGELDILLSSEVGGEGLDFQYCQAIANYDLPYNPMRVEQRIGRIDRFGQTAEKIFIVNMFIKHTVDEDIYMALYDRINLVKESIGGLEPILGTKLIDLQKDIISGQLSKKQLDNRVKELEITLEKAKIEKEQFEENRRVLMGDDYFTNPLHNLEKQTDFVKPSDAAHLTMMCLSLFDNCNYNETDLDRGQIQLSKEILARLGQYVRRPGSEGSITELSPIIEARFPINVIFNGSRTQQYNDHIFLPPCGFWIRFLLSELESEREIKKVFCFHYSGNDHHLNRGKYIVPLFEIKLEGFRVELDIAAVPINLQDGKVADCNFRNFSRKMNNFVKNCTADIEHIEFDNVELLIDRGAEELEKQMGSKLENLQAENKYRINARINSLERGSQVRIDRLKQKIKDHIQRRHDDVKDPSKKFIQLTERTIESERKRTEEKINKLQNRNELSLTISLIGISIMFVD